MKKLLLILLFAFCLFTFPLKSQWVQQSVPVSKPITGIKFIDANTGWALSSSTSSLDTCYILHTSNGGTNWTVQYTNINSMYLGLSVVDANTVYAGGIMSGATANLTKTTNGGLNWLVIPTPTNMSILDIQFVNKDSGWTVGGSVGPDVRTTTNGGLNWIVRTNGIAQQTQKIFFLNYNTGYCGANSFLYKTTNAGLNWVQTGFFVEQINSIFFNNVNTGWLGCTNRKIRYTANGGLNWIEQINPQLLGTINDIVMLNDTLGYAGGRSMYVYVTTNGGNLWGYQNNNSGSYRIKFIDNLTGWSCDNGISKTTNGGGPITYVGINNISTEIPGSLKLYQNFPNPFNPVTNIKFDLSTKSHLQLIVFDMLGKAVSELINETLSAGKYEYVFTANNLPSGTYFYRLITNNFTETKRMILIK